MAASLVGLWHSDQSVIFRINIQLANQYCIQVLLFSQSQEWATDRAFGQHSEDVLILCRSDRKLWAATSKSQARTKRRVLGDQSLNWHQTSCTLTSPQKTSWKQDLGSAMDYLPLHPKRTLAAVKSPCQNSSLCWLVREETTANCSTKTHTLSPPPISHHITAAIGKGRDAQTQHAISRVWPRVQMALAFFNAALTFFQ